MDDEENTTKFGLFPLFKLYSFQEELLASVGIYDERHDALRQTPIAKIEKITAPNRIPIRQLRKIIG